MAKNSTLDPGRWSDEPVTPHPPPAGMDAECLAREKERTLREDSLRDAYDYADRARRWISDAISTRVTFGPELAEKLYAELERARIQTRDLLGLLDELLDDR